MQVQTHIKLNDKQRLAFYSPATEILYGGAAGGGKSLLLRVSAIRWCEEIPGIQVYLFRRTFPELKDNHLRGPTSFHNLLASKLESGAVRYNKQENEFVFKNGSRIALCYCQYEDDVEKYRGAEIHVLMMDELTHFTDYQYRFLRGRVRLAGLHVPARYKGFLPRIEAGSNPGSVGHKWVKEAFVHEPVKIFRMSEDEGGMFRQYIPAKLSDNPELTKEDPQYVERLKGLGSASLVEAMLDGNWDIFEGKFFEEWRRELHVLPSEFINQIGPDWTRFGAYDHGYFHPAVFGEFAVDPDGIIYLINEWGDRRKRVDEIAKAIHEICDVSKLDYIVAGHDCWSKQRDGSKSVFEQFMQLPITHGIKRIMLQKAKIDRVQGASELRKLIAWQGVERGPRFYVLENCRRTINCLPDLLHDERNPEDVMKVDATEQDTWAGDDPYDMVRYGVMSRPNLPKPVLTDEMIEASFVQLTPEERMQIWKKKRIKQLMNKRKGGWDPHVGRI